MNKLFNKIATGIVSFAMAIGVGVAIGSGKNATRVRAMDDSYNVGSTPLSSVTNNQLVAWGTSSSNLAYTITSDWVKCNTTKSDWIVFKVVTTTNGFYLVDNSNTTNYVYSSATKKVAWGTGSNKTVLTLNSDNLVYNATAGKYTLNSTGIRPYTSNTYTKAYLYEVTPATKYTVKYDANGGSGAPSPQTNLDSLTSVTLASTSSMTKFGYTSTGWSRDEGGGTWHYNSGASGVNLSSYADANKTVTLYAYWEAKNYTGLVYEGTPTTTTYTTDDEFDPTGITHIYAKFDNVSDTTVDLKNDIDWDPLVAGTTATGTYAIGSTTQTVTVTGLTITQVTSWTDTLTSSDDAATGTSYATKTGIAKSSSARYTMVTNQPESGKFGFRVSGSDSGIVSTTSGGVIGSVSVSNCQADRTIQVYGSDQAYSSPSDLFSDSTKGTLLGTLTSSSSTLNISGEYEYVGVRSSASAINMTGITFVWNLPSSDPAVELDSSSATEVSVMKDNTDNSIKVRLKNIDTPSWSFTFDEDSEEGVETSSYINVSAGALSEKNVSILTITTKAVGSTEMHISVSGTTCATSVPITVTQRPRAGTMVAKLNSVVVSSTVEVQTGAYKQFTFAAEDTDGNAYSIAAEDVTGVKQSGTAAITISGTRVTGDTVGTAVVRYSLNVLDSVYIDISFNVIDDYLVSVNSVTFNTGLAATQGDSPTTAVFASRIGNTHFGSTAEIPLENFRFSYSNEMGAPSTQFGYDFEHGVVVDSTHKLQTIYVYCTLGNASCGSYTVLIQQKDDPLTAITISNVTDNAQDITRGDTFQLEVTFTPTNPTDGKGLVYRVDDYDDGVVVGVNSTGLISVEASSALGTALIVVESDHDETIWDYVYVTVKLEEMTYIVDETESSWNIVSDISTLKAGDQVILTGIKSGTTYAASTYSGSGNNIPADTTNTLTVSETKVTGVVSTMIYTLATGTVEGSLAFKDSSGNYLYAASSGSNYMKSQSTIDNNASFVLNSNGTVVAQGTNSRCYMRYNNDSTNNLFSCYSSTSTTGNLVTFYKKSGGETPYTVTEDLFNAVTNNFGEDKTYEWNVTCEDFDGDGWLDACSEITDLTDFEDYKLNRAIADANGNEIEQFLARYDIVISKVGTSHDWLGRFDEDGINYGQLVKINHLSILNGNANTAAIVIITSVVTGLAIGGYFFLRKKKED